MVVLIFIIMNISLLSFGDVSAIDPSVAAINEVTSTPEVVDEFEEYRNKPLILTPYDMMFLTLSICGFMASVFIN